MNIPLNEYIDTEHISQARNTFSHPGHGTNNDVKDFASVVRASPGHNYNPGSNIFADGLGGVLCGNACLYVYIFGTTSGHRTNQLIFYTCFGSHSNCFGRSPLVCLTDLMCIYRPIDQMSPGCALHTWYTVTTGIDSTE